MSAHINQETGTKKVCMPSVRKVTYFLAILVCLSSEALQEIHFEREVNSLDQKILFHFRQFAIWNERIARILRICWCLTIVVHTDRQANQQGDICGDNRSQHQFGPKNKYTLFLVDVAIQL